MESLPLHFEGGQSTERSKQFNSPEEKDFIRSMDSSNSSMKTPLLNKEKESVMQESHPATKREILSDKKNCSEPSFQIIESSLMLDRVSIGNDTDLKPFWNPFTREISKKLPSVIKTGSVDLDSTSWNGSLKKLASNSWFSMKAKQYTNPSNKNSPKVSSQSPQSLWQDIMECDQLNIKKKEKNPNAKPKKEPKPKDPKAMEEAALKRKAKKEAMKEEVEKELKRIRQETKVIPVNQEAMKKVRKKRSMDTTKPKKQKSEKTEQVQKPKKPKAEKVLKIRIYPNHQQKQVLNRWFGAARWIYNKALDYVKNQHGGDAKYLDDIYLRPLFLDNANYIGTENEWMIDCPADIREGALCDLQSAFKSNFTSLGRGQKTHFDVKFKSKKKCKGESIAIHSKAYKDAGVFYPTSFKKPISTKIPKAPRQRKERKHTRFKKPRPDYTRAPGRFYTGWIHGKISDPMIASEPLPKKLTHDSKIHKTILGEYYLCIAKPLDIRSENQGPEFINGEGNVIALDPGVRTFQTCYDSKGMSFEWGKGDLSRIYRLTKNYDKIQSIRSDSTLYHKKRYRLKRAMRKIYRKVKDLVRELHCKLVKWLCENYNLVLIPLFETSKMVIRRMRRIGSETAKGMLTWSHFKFRQRLIHKAREFPWCKVLIVNEAYTSITCGNCGELHHNLRAKKNFVCPGCRVEMDRDVNGARNVLLRFVTKNHRIGKRHYVSEIKSHQQRDLRTLPCVQSGVATTATGDRKVGEGEGPETR